MDGVVHLFYGLWLISNQVRLMFHKSNILGLSGSSPTTHILCTTGVHMSSTSSSHLLDRLWDTLVWHTQESREYEVQCRTSSIIMENKQRHGIWSLLKALSLYLSLLVYGPTAVVWSGFPSSWWLHICTVNYCIHEVTILLNGQYLDYSGLFPNCTPHYILAERSITMWWIIEKMVADSINWSKSNSNHMVRNLWWFPTKKKYSIDRARPITTWKGRFQPAQFSSITFMIHITIGRIKPSRVQ